MARPSTPSSTPVATPEGSNPNLSTPSTRSPAAYCSNRTLGTLRAFVPWCSEEAGQSCSNYVEVQLLWRYWSGSSLFCPRVALRRQSRRQRALTARQQHRNHLPNPVRQGSPQPISARNWLVVGRTSSPDPRQRSAAAPRTQRACAARSTLSPTRSRSRYAQRSPSSPRAPRRSLS